MLTHWNDIDRTFTMLDELRRRMDRLWDEYDPARDDRRFAAPTVRSAWPRVNLFDAGASLVLYAEVPGLAEKDLQLTINQDVLTLRGERRVEAPEGYSAHRQERLPVQFARSFALPTKIDPEKTTAVLKDGVLTMTLPKAPEAQPKHIAVTARG